MIDGSEEVMTLSKWMGSSAPKKDRERQERGTNELNSAGLTSNDQIELKRSIAMSFGIRS